MRIAAEKGDFVTVEGQKYPFTTDCVDAGWNKRSYGHSYISLAAVGVIIGVHTRKIIVIAICNKFCIICKHHVKSNIKLLHVCYQNWSAQKSSTSMEPDIFREGFRMSIAMHGLVYKMVGDGDSSMLFSILTDKVYHGNEVENIECVNHAVKRFKMKVIEITKKAQYDLPHRNLIRSNMKCLRTSLRSAIIHNNADPTCDAKSLANDILNIPNHTFGDHIKCKDDFCKRKNPKEVNQAIHLRKVRSLVGINRLSGHCCWHCQSTSSKFNQQRV